MMCINTIRCNRCNHKRSTTPLRNKHSLPNLTRIVNLKLPLKFYRSQFHPTLFFFIISPSPPFNLIQYKFKYFHILRLGPHNCRQSSNPWNNCNYLSLTLSVGLTGPVPSALSIKQFQQKRNRCRFVYIKLTHLSNCRNRLLGSQKCSH